MNLCRFALPALGCQNRRMNYCLSSPPRSRSQSGSNNRCFGFSNMHANTFRPILSPRISSIVYESTTRSSVAASGESSSASQPRLSVYLSSDPWSQGQDDAGRTLAPCWANACQCTVYSQLQGSHAAPGPFHWTMRVMLLRGTQLPLGRRLRSTVSLLLQVQCTVV